MEYQSTIQVESVAQPGVKYTIRRISLSGRVALGEAVRQLAREMDFLGAGESFDDKVGAAILGGKIQRIYLEWGLVDIAGLTIDGSPPGVSLLVEQGPENLCAEIAERIRQECGLSESERKN